MSKMYTATVKLSDVFADFDRNFRDPLKDYLDCNPTEGFDRDKYEAGMMPAGFFEDILINGIQTPITVVLLTEAQVAEVLARTGKTYKWRLVKGHRRIYTANLVNSKFPDSIIEVNAIVYEGLTAMEEWEKLADHSATRRETELSGLGVYRAVIRLHAAGFSQERIAIMMGKAGRGYTQRHVSVHAMRNATPIETHWIGIHLPKDDADRPSPCFKFTNKNVDDLYPLFNADRAAGRNPMEIGSEFRKEWDRITTTGKSSADSAVKAFKRDEILARKTFAEGRPAILEALDYAANNGGAIDNAVAMYDRLAEKAAKADSLIFDNDRLKTEASGLAVERDGFLGQTVSLTSQVEALRAEITAKDATIFGLTESVDSLNATIEALRAEIASLKASKPAGKRNG